ncbi:MAG: segregation and condensation protein [Patescibacteria group bacterium]|jgi:segregation and condensation protein B|nr:segregation and condensation protein [Patescibacteria group bacterium]
MEKEELSLTSKIEALLFYKGEPVSFSSIAKSFNASAEEVQNSISELKNSLNERGVCLVQNEKEVMLGTNPKMSSFFEEMRKEELNKELSKASLETLSIVLYKEKVSRAEIDFIRGVNSTFILRNLAVRGLVDKEQDPKDSRVSLFKPSLELLSYLGVSSSKDLPNYEEIVVRLQNKIEDIQNENNI